MNTDTPITDAARVNCTGSQIDSMPAHIWQVMSRLERDHARLRDALQTARDRILAYERPIPYDLLTELDATLTANR